MKTSDKQPAAQQPYKSWKELPHVPVSYPQLGSIGATGEWRTFKPEINAEACNKCGMCYLYCPDGVISYKEGTLPEIDYMFCKGCGICASICPKKAIEMVKEKE